MPTHNAPPDCSATQTHTHTNTHTHCLSPWQEPKFDFRSLMKALKSVWLCIVFSARHALLWQREFLAGIFLFILVSFMFVVWRVNVSSGHQLFWREKMTEMNLSILLRAVNLLVRNQNFNFNYENLLKISHKEKQQNRYMCSFPHYFIIKELLLIAYNKYTK